MHFAASETIIFEAITGSHVRVSESILLLRVVVFVTETIPKPSKLSEMAYAVLQLICSYREKGIAIDTITKTTGYTSGNVFYFVKVLCELGYT